MKTIRVGTTTVAVAAAAAAAAAEAAVASAAAATVPFDQYNRQSSDQKRIGKNANGM